MSAHCLEMILRPSKNPLFYCPDFLSENRGSSTTSGQSHNFGCAVVRPPWRILPYTPSSSVLGSLEIMRFRYETGFLDDLIQYSKIPRINPRDKPREMNGGAFWLK